MLGFTVGFWLGGWAMSGLMALGTVALAAITRNSWIGIIYGVICGLFVVPAFHSEWSTPVYPLLMGMLGGFLGSFLGDAWRFSWTNPVQQPVPPDASQPEHEPTHDPVENRQRNGLRSRQ